MAPAIQAAQQAQTPGDEPQGSGPSLTAGFCGAHVTLGERGVTRTVGISGTGI